jgi:hypothetical protein
MWLWVQVPPSRPILITKGGESMGWIIFLIFAYVFGFSILHSIPRDNEEEEYKEFKKFMEEWNIKHNKR